jgi:prenylcysteine oxidase / farnesylcysteine lyase
MRPSLLLAVAAATYGAHAFDIPLQVPFDLGKLNGSTEAAESTRPPQTPSSVAIIGAGAGGSSAAFWIGLAKARWGLDIDVDVYESLDRVGGRE